MATVARSARVNVQRRKAPRRKRVHALPAGTAFASSAVEEGELASRVAGLEPEGAYRVLAQAGKLESQGHDIVHLEIGQPGYEAPEHVRDAAFQAVQQGRTKYVNPSGIDELRDVIAEHVADTRGVAVERGNVVVGPGAKPGLFFTAMALVNPGDSIAFPDPGFPTYKALCDVTGAVAKPIPVTSDGSSLDMGKLRECIAQDRPKMLIVNSPSNPTGGVMPEEDVAEVSGIAKKEGVWVVSDEIYSRLVYSAAGAPSPFRKHSSHRTILVDGFSKTFSMTGWRLGWAVMPHHLAQKVDLLLTHSVGCTAPFTQAAGVAALRGDQSGVRAMVSEYQKRRDFVVDSLNSCPGVSCPKGEGAFYAFPDVSSLGESAAKLCERLLSESGVATLPGTDFGTHGEGRIRISYVGSPESLEEGMERFYRFCQSVQGR